MKKALIATFVILWITSLFVYVIYRLNFSDSSNINRAVELVEESDKAPLFIAHQSENYLHHRGIVSNKGEDYLELYVKGVNGESSAQKFTIDSNYISYICLDESALNTWISYNTLDSIDGNSELRKMFLPYTDQVIDDIKILEEIIISNKVKDSKEERLPDIIIWTYGCNN